MAESALHSKEVHCVDCGRPRASALSPRAAAFFEALAKLDYHCDACWGPHPRRLPRGVSVPIEEDLLDWWRFDPALRLATDEEAALAKLETATLIRFAARTDGRPEARRALLFALVEQWLSGGCSPGDMAGLARSFLSDRLKFWAAPEPGDIAARRDRRRAALRAMAERPGD